MTSSRKSAPRRVVGVSRGLCLSTRPRVTVVGGASARTSTGAPIVRFLTAVGSAGTD